MGESWSRDKIINFGVKHKAGECCCYVPEILTKLTVSRYLWCFKSKFMQNMRQIF